MFDLNELKKYGLVAADLELADHLQAREDIRLSGRNINFSILERKSDTTHCLVIATPADMRWILREWCYDEEFINDYLDEWDTMWTCPHCHRDMLAWQKDDHRCG